MGPVLRPFSFDLPRCLHYCKRTGAALVGVAIYTDGRAQLADHCIASTGRQGGICGIAYRENKRAYRVNQIRRAPEDWSGCIIAGKHPSQLSFSRVTNAGSICHPTFRLKI